MAERPSWFKAFLQKSQLQDESRLINLGFSDDTDIYNIEIDNVLQSSSWTNYPSRYKFISYQIQISDIVKVTNRETYSLLEFLGDIGGLWEFLFIFA